MVLKSVNWMLTGKITQGSVDNQADAIWTLYGPPNEHGMGSGQIEYLLMQKQMLKAGYGHLLKGWVQFKYNMTYRQAEKIFPKNEYYLEICRGNGHQTDYFFDNNVYAMGKATTYGDWRHYNPTAAKINGKWAQIAIRKNKPKPRIHYSLADAEIAQAVSPVAEEEDDPLGALIAEMSDDEEDIDVKEGEGPLAEALALEPSEADLLIDEMDDQKEAPALAPVREIINMEEVVDSDIEVEDISDSEEEVFSQESVSDSDDEEDHGPQGQSEHPQYAPVQAGSRWVGGPVLGGGKVRIGWPG